MNGFRIWYRTQPPALRALLTINVVFYIFWILGLGRIGSTHQFVLEHLALHPYLPTLLFEPWQLVTYNFLHLGLGFWNGLIHIAFNMLWLYWIGKEFEEMHGSQSLLAVYLWGGIGGGLLSLLVYAFFPGSVIVHGASASVLGVITAVAVFYPQKKIGLLFIGVVRLIHLVIAYLAINLLFMAGGGTAVAAHFGGALFGFLFAKGEQRGTDLSSWAGIFLGGRARGKRRSSRRDQGTSWLDRVEAWLSSSSTKKQQSAAPQKETHRPATPSSVSNVSSNEVDRILDKISEQGYDALTEEEKRILYEASKR